MNINSNCNLIRLKRNLKEKNMNINLMRDD